MVEMDIAGKLVLIAVIGALIGGIVLYHLWVDRRRETRPTADPAPPGAPETPQVGAGRVRSVEKKDT